MDQDFRELLRKESIDNLTDFERARLKRFRSFIVPNYGWAEAQIQKELYPEGFTEDERSPYEYADNFRIARTDNEHEMETFEEAKRRGCCGSYEWEVVDPDGIRWVVGFNYGH